MTPCLLIWGSMTNLESQNFLAHLSWPFVIKISSGASLGWVIDFERFTHAQMVSLKIDLVHWFHFF